jgi:hypothetical protein
MPQPDDITARDEGSFAKRPNKRAGSRVGARTRSITAKVALPSVPRVPLIVIGIIHILVGAAGALSLFWWSCLFLVTADYPASDYQLVNFICADLAQDVLLTAASPIGIGIILRKSWAVTGTTMLSILIAVVFAVALYFYFRSGVRLVSLPLIDFTPSLIYLCSSFALWLIARLGCARVI